MLEENSDLPNLDPEGHFRRFAEMRHKSAIETEAFDWTIKTRARKLRAWRSCVLLASRETVCIMHKVSGSDPARVIGIEGGNV